MGNTKIIDYIVALTNLYGLVTIDKVVEIYNMQNKDQIKIEELANSDYDEILEDHYIDVIEDLFVDSFMDSDEFEILYISQQNKPYYIPKKVDLLKYKDPDYFEKTSQYLDLLKYVKKEILPHDLDALDLCLDIQMFTLLEGGNIIRIMHEIERRQINFKDINQVNKLLSLITDFVNNYRLRENRGHTSQELSKFMRQRIIH